MDYSNGFEWILRRVRTALAVRAALRATAGILSCLTRSHVKVSFEMPEYTGEAHELCNPLFPCSVFSAASDRKYLGVLTP